MGSIDVGDGVTVTGSRSQARLPAEMETATTSPSATPSVVSHPFLVVIEDPTAIGVEFNCVSPADERLDQTRSYSSWRRSQSWNPSSSSRPFGVRSRIG